MIVDNNYIRKKMIITSMVFTYGGLLLILAGVLFAVGVISISIVIRIVAVLPGLAAVVYGSYITTKKCRCPFCKFGDGDRARHGDYHALLSPKSIKAGQITCPRCNKTIIIK